MLQIGVIEPSNSPWAAAVVLAPKKDGTLRFCLDYRSLNSVTKRDVYPLPRPDDLVQQLSGSTVFSSLDMKQGFWHVPVAPEDQEKTAFVTPDGLYQFKRLPYGLTNSPATFMPLVDRILAGLKWTHCLAYLDDVLIYGETFEQHLERLEMVLEAMAAAGIKHNASMCRFGVQSVTYLGHIIDSSGLRPDPSKLQAVTDYPRPHDVTSLKSFLVFMSFYRHFIEGFARLAWPLHQLLKKDVPWRWGEEESAAMRILQDALLSAPTLAHDNEADQLMLKTDASKQGLGAVLSVSRGGTEYPLTFISRRTTPAEANYHFNELECAALVWSAGKLRPFLLGRRVVVMTDNSALRWLYLKKEMSDKIRTPTCSVRAARASLRLCACFVCSGTCSLQNSLNLVSNCSSACLASSQLLFSLPISFSLTIRALIRLALTTPYILALLLCGTIAVSDLQFETRHHHFIRQRSITAFFVVMATDIGLNPRRCVIDKSTADFGQKCCHMVVRVAQISALSE